jgi:hypothetical protein
MTAYYAEEPTSQRISKARLFRKWPKSDESSITP